MSLSSVNWHLRLRSHYDGTRFFVILGVHRPSVFLPKRRSGRVPSYWDGWRTKTWGSEDLTLSYLKTTKFGLISNTIKLYHKDSLIVWILYSLPILVTHSLGKKRFRRLDSLPLQNVESYFKLFFLLWSQFLMSIPSFIQKRWRIYGRRVVRNE